MKRQQLFTTFSFLCLLATAAFGQTPERVTIKSEVLGEERVALVRTPNGYERGDQRFPVLYMTDGNAQIDHTGSTMEFLARSGRVPQLIIVAITNTDRTRDLTPTVGKDVPQGQASGGADKFLKFIETELIPKIESSYRVQPYRIIAGRSYGGLFALHAFMAMPEVFNAYIAVSPSMQWDNQLLTRRAEEFFKDRKELNRTLFFTLANEHGEVRIGYDRFKEILSQSKPKNFAWDSMLMEDEDHGSVVLRSHYFGLRKIFDGWKIAAIAKGDRVTVAIVEDHYKMLSAKFGFPVLPPEELMNALGYQLMGRGTIKGRGTMDEAITVFKTNVERYPNSANVYDSLAEAYEKSGKIEIAKTNYEKAVQLGQKYNDPALQIYKTNFDRVVEILKKTAENKNK